MEGETGTSRVQQRKGTHSVFENVMRQVDFMSFERSNQRNRLKKVKKRLHGVIVERVEILNI